MGAFVGFAVQCLFKIFGEGEKTIHVGVTLRDSRYRNRARVRGETGREQERGQMSVPAFDGLFVFVSERCHQHRTACVALFSALSVLRVAGCRACQRCRFLCREPFSFLCCCSVLSCVLSCHALSCIVVPVVLLCLGLYRVLPFLSVSFFLVCFLFLRFAFLSCPFPSCFFLVLSCLVAYLPVFGVP